MQSQFRDTTQNGGVKSYPSDQMYEEVAFIAYYFHWDYATIMNMDHFERRKWCEEISKINKKMSEETGQKSLLDM